MSKHITKKDFVKHIDDDIPYEEYSNLTDDDHCLRLGKLYEILSKVFNITFKT